MECKIDGCGRPVFATGLCSTHYNRQRTRGTTDDGPRARLPLPERFWRYVRKAGPDECWEWTGWTTIHGYGAIGTGGRGSRKISAHRLAWFLHNGELPKIDDYHGAVVMHDCDNRKCCNPAHLRVGRQAENVADMDRKNRRQTKIRAGEAHHEAKFTEADIRAIRASKLNNAELGRQYGVYRSAIRSIRKKLTWRHVK